MNEWQSLLQKRNDVPSVATSFDSGIDTANKIRENQLANRKAYEINSMNEALGQAFKGMDKDGNPVIDQKVFAQILIDKKLGHLVQPARMDREVAKAKAAKDVAEASMWLDPTQVKAAQDMEKSAQEPQISIPIPQVNLQTPSLIPTIQAPDTKKILQELGQKRDELSKKYASSDKKEDVRYVQQELMRLGLAPALQKNGKPFDDGIKGKETDSVLSKLKLTSSKSLVPPGPQAKTLEADGTISTRESQGIQIGQPKESEVGKQLERLWSKAATPDLEGIMQSNSSGFDLEKMATEPQVSARAKQLQPALQAAFDRIDETTRAQATSLSVNPTERRKETRELMEANRKEKEAKAKEMLAQAGSDQGTRQALNNYYNALEETKIRQNKLELEREEFDFRQKPRWVKADNKVYELNSEANASYYSTMKRAIDKLSSTLKSPDFKIVGSIIGSAELGRIAGTSEGVEQVEKNASLFSPSIANRFKTGEFSKTGIPTDVWRAMWSDRPDITKRIISNIVMAASHDLDKFVTDNTIREVPTGEVSKERLTSGTKGKKTGKKPSGGGPIKIEWK